jgi:hypothetical protein
MTRVLAIAIVMALVGTAWAKPPEADQKAEKKKADAEKKKKADAEKKKADAEKKKKADAEKKKADAEPVQGPPKPADLKLKDPANQRINLFPTRVLQNRSKTERERRMTLGDDGNWKVQAAQVGAMVGIFGALVGLCGGGKCLIPRGQQRAAGLDARRGAGLQQPARRAEGPADPLVLV